MNTDQIGLRVRNLRGEMSQQAFADLLEVGRVSITRYETGERTPDAEFLYKAYKKLGVDIVWLLTGERSNNLGSAGNLSPRELVLIESYRAANDAGKKVIESTAFFASPPAQEAPVKQKASGSRNIQIGGNVSGGQVAIHEPKAEYSTKKGQQSNAKRQKATGK